MDLDHERFPLHSDKKVTYSKFISMSLIAFCSELTILVRQWGLKAKNDPVLVLDAKGGEIKAKASNWISYHLRTLKVELEVLICQNTLSVSCCQKLVSCGENV